MPISSVPSRPAHCGTRARTKSAAASAVQSPWLAVECGIPLFQRQHDRTRDRIGDAEAAAKVLKRVAERIERGEHVRARVRECLHVGPLADDTVAALAGLDHVDALQAGPV